MPDDDETLSSDELIRRAREALDGTGEDGTAHEFDVELDEDEIDAMVAAELEPDPSPITTSPPTPRVGPPDPAMQPVPTPTFGDEPPDTRRGLVLAVGAAAIGSLAWALLFAYAEVQTWLLGIGIGWLIGTAAIKGAGRLSDGLKVGVGLLAVGSVLFGDVLGVALLWNKEIGFFDLPLAAEVYVRSIGDFSRDFLFTVAGGALGAWTAIRQTT